MERWLECALDYIPRWIEFQLQLHQQPGCAIAITYQGKVVLDTAFGSADLTEGTPLTPRHRFRVASHSKSFTAAGILKLRDQNKLRLDDPAGKYVSDLHPAVARVTIAQLLSHSAGITRDGADSGQFLDQRPFLNEKELRAGLKDPPMIAPNTRFKYSNHGFGLAGLVIEAITGEPYGEWIQREIVEAAGLKETQPDMPLPRGTPFAHGHSGTVLLGERIVIPADMPTHALAPATGFVSTAADLARFFSQLSPDATRSVISVESRREMTRRHWRNPHAFLEGYYGLGTISGSLNGWDWFGHAGAFPGTLTRTCMVPAEDLCVSVLTNAIDGLCLFWLDGAMHVLRAFAQRGAPEPRLADWGGRWWTVWGATDLIPVGNRVLVALPGLLNPLQDASEVAVDARGSRDAGRIVLAHGYASHGEPARLVRGGGAKGKVQEVWLGGTRLVPQAKLAAEVAKRYGRSGASSAKRQNQ